ncbi:MAG: response regulator, partial [Candidatus Brocadiales bacterium]
MGHKTILMVEDNPDDVELAVREFKKNNLLNNVVVTRDGVEALDYLFCVGAYVSRDVKDLPLVVLLDLRLPRLDGIDVLRCLRSDERTKDLPVVMLTTSKQEQDMVATHNLGVS